MDEGERVKLQLILNSYTAKILHYYMEHEQLPSIAIMQQMREETIDEPTPKLYARGRD